MESIEKTMGNDIVMDKNLVFRKSTSSRLEHVSLEQHKNISILNAWRAEILTYYLYMYIWLSLSLKIYQKIYFHELSKTVTIQ